MNSLISKITQKINEGKFLDAEELSWDLYKSNKNFYNTKTLALTLLLQNKHYGSLDFYLKAYELKDNDFDVLVNIAYIYLKFEEFEKSYNFCQKALLLDSVSHLVYISLLDIYVRKREFERAYECAIELLKKINFQTLLQKPNVIYLILDSYLAAGKNEEALQLIQYFYKKIFNPDIFYYHSTFSPETISPELEKIAFQILNQTEFKSMIDKGKTLGPLYFGLAKYNEKNKKNKISDEQYISANKEIFDIQRYQPLANQKLVNNIKNIFNDNRDLDYPQYDDSGLIFIIGMPRSGTTLVESIISSNENSFSGGELRSIYELFKSRYDVDDELIDFQDPGGVYLNRIKFIRNNKKHFIDKLPGNYHNVGFIKKVFPNAKIIYLKRDPWDNAISLFKQFYVSNIPFASSFFNMGVVYANHEELMRFWKEDLKINYLTIEYEKLVQDTENIANQIYEFCEIKEGYKSSIRKNFFARTASKNQVTKDVHMESIGKTSFEEQKNEFIKSLENQRNYWAKS